MQVLARLDDFRPPRQSFPNGAFHDDELNGTVAE
jgi:hypothetical protein